MFRIPMAGRFTIAALVLASTGCGGGGSNAPALPPDSESRPTYRILDLASGQVTDTEVLPDLLSDGSFRTTRMAFRRVESGVYELGTPDTAIQDLATGDEPDRTVALSAYYVAVFETTQAQWQLIAGATGLNPTPWTSATGVTGDISTAPATVGRPAANIPFASASQAAAAFRIPGHMLALPTADEWEAASRGVRTFQAFAWGDATDAAAAGPYALVREVAPAATGPVPVGRRLPNAAGLYDVHGNLREWDASGVLRGGGWSDNILSARSANRLTGVDGAFGYAAAGVRFVLR
ncbi:MAG: hypothetical protein RLZZ127_72 [Planctomycetota bacterium]|jgi:formylglycine-generating enzyme required for sulfatase activity